MMETTSLEAYGNLKSSGLLTRQQHVVLQALKRHGPSTASELTAAILAERGGAPDPSYQKRLSELVRKGVAIKLPSRPCRITKHAAIVWASISPDSGVGRSLGAPESVLSQHEEAPRHRVESATPRGEPLSVRGVSPGAGRKESGSPLFSFCGCGRVTASETCPGCGVVSCQATGHARHECGGIQ